MEQPKKLNAKQRYYHKNKDLCIERVRQQREEKKTIQNTQNILRISEPVIQNHSIPKARVAIVRIPFPALDFLIWNKLMTYITVDIRDITGQIVWNGKPANSKKENAPATILDDNHYIDCIKRLLKFGDRYVIKIPSTKLDIPVFFQIKEKKKIIKLLNM